MRETIETAKVAAVRERHAQVANRTVVGIFEGGGHLSEIKDTGMRMEFQIQALKGETMRLGCLRDKNWLRQIAVL